MNASIGVVGAHGLDVTPVADHLTKSVDRDPASNKKVKKCHITQNLTNCENSITIFMLTRE